jgi:hypothetical protein
VPNDDDDDEDDDASRNLNIVTDADDIKYKVHT